MATAVLDAIGLVHARPVAHATVVGAGGIIVTIVEAEEGEAGGEVVRGQGVEVETVGVGLAVPVQDRMIVIGITVAGAAVVHGAGVGAVVGAGSVV